MCDLNPQKTCRFTTKLVPKLTPKEECTVVPRETCHLSFSAPVAGKKPLITKWCMDDDNDILLGLEQTGGAAANTGAVADGSDSSALGEALVPPVAGLASDQTSANVPTPYNGSSEGAARIPSRASSSNDDDSLQQNVQLGGQRGAGKAVRKRPSVLGQVRPNIQGQEKQGKPSRNEQRKPTSDGGEVRPNNKRPNSAGQGLSSEGIQKRPRISDQIRPTANAGQRRPVNGGKGNEDQRKPTNLGKGKPTNGRPTKVRPTNPVQEVLTKGGQQRPSDVAQSRPTNKGQRKPTTNQGKERIVSGKERKPNQEGQGTLSNSGQGIQNLVRPSYGNGGQGNPGTDSLLTSDPNSSQIEEAQPGYGTERPLQGNSRQPTFSVSVGELRPPQDVVGVNTVASQAPEAYLPPPSLDYPSSEDLSFGLPQDNPSYGNEAIIGTHASGPRPLPGQLADLSDLPDLEDYYDQLPNSLQSYYDQAEDYYYDQYDQDLELAAPVAPDTGYGSPGRRQTRRVDPLRRGWMSYQELLG